MVVSHSEQSLLWLILAVADGRTVCLSQQWRVPKKQSVVVWVDLELQQESAKEGYPSPSHQVEVSGLAPPTHKGSIHRKSRYLQMSWPNTGLNLAKQDVWLKADVMIVQEVHRSEPHTVQSRLRSGSSVPEEPPPVQSWLRSVSSVPEDSRVCWHSAAISQTQLEI